MSLLFTLPLQSPRRHVLNENEKTTYEHYSVIKHLPGCDVDFAS